MRTKIEPFGEWRIYMFETITIAISIILLIGAAIFSWKLDNTGPVLNEKKESTGED